MNREELKNHIPYGYGKVIAQKAGVSERSVSNYMSGKTNSIKIEMAALQVLAELGEEKKELINKIN